MRILELIGVLTLTAMVASGALADGCIPLLRSVSESSSFPNRVAGTIASSGSGYGLAKTDSRLPREIRFALLDSELNQIGADIPIANSSHRGAIATIWTGNEFGLFYETPDRRLVLQRISSGGASNGAPIPIADTHGIWPDREYDILWDSSRNVYVLVYTIPQGGSRGVWLSLVSPNGTVVSDAQVGLFVADPIMPQAALTSAGLVVIYHHSVTGQMHAVLISPDGTNSQAFAVAAPGADPQLAWNGSQLVYVTSIKTVGGGSEIHWTRLDASGAILGREAKLFTAEGIDATPSFLVWNANDSEWALGYRTSLLGFSEFAGDYRLHRFRADGARISNSYFSPEAAQSALNTTHPFLWNGVAYITSIERKGNEGGGSQSFVVRHCPLRATATADRKYASPIGDNVLFTPIVSGGTPPYFYDWDLKDPTTSNNYARNPSHHYRSTGTYNVVLTVTDSIGATAVSTVTIVVGIPRGRVVRK